MGATPQKWYAQVAIGIVDSTVRVRVMSGSSLTGFGLVEPKLQPFDCAKWNPQPFGRLDNQLLLVASSGLRIASFCGWTPRTCQIGVSKVPNESPWHLLSILGHCGPIGRDGVRLGPTKKLFWPFPP